MDRVFESGAVGSPPSAPASPSTGYTTAGNPSTATPATKPGPYWFHQVTEELRAVIVGAGLTPSHTNLEQLKQAINTLIDAGKGLGSSGIVLLNATTTLTNAAHVGKTVLFDGTATGAFTVTLPLANTVTTGRRIHFHNVSSFDVTVQRQGSNAIYPNGASINSIVVGPGDTLTLEAYNGTSWFAVGGTSQISFSTAMPIGEVSFFPVSNAPFGWLKANGSAVSRTAYSRLFSVIGTTFGTGDGSTTFNLPDLRAEFIRGWDDGRGVDSGRVFGSSQTDALKSHTHQFRSTGSTAEQSGTGGGGSRDAASLVDSVRIGSTGGTETRPRNIALLACIKY